MERYSLKRDYYDQLRQDYYEAGERCFVFRYLEKNPRSDTCFRVVLRQNREELKAGRVSRLDFVCDIVEKLSKTPKLYQEGGDYKLILPLLYYGLGLSEEEYQVLKHTDRKKDIHEKLLLLEKQMLDPDGAARKRMSKIPLGELESMTCQLELVSLRVEVRNFFYEIGLPITDLDKQQKKAAVKRKPERKKDPSLNMLDAYCAQKNFSLSAPGARVRPDDEDYDAFFQKIAKNPENSGVILPIMIDVQTGCALFIIGKDYINDFQYVIDLKKNKAYKDYCCSYGVLELDTYRPKAGTSKGDRERLLYHAMTYLFSYAEACDDYDISRREHLDDLKVYNLSLRGMEHPNSLDVYFSKEKEWEETEERHKDREKDGKFREVMAEVGPRETLGRSKRL